MFKFLLCNGQGTVRRAILYTDRSCSLHYLYFILQVAVNAWTWSTIFHTKDTDFTEVKPLFLLNMEYVISMVEQTVQI